MGATTPPVIPPAAPAAQVEAVIEIREISNVLRRAFVAGEAVHVIGNAPAGCSAPALHIDGRLVGLVEPTSNGSFDIPIVTRDLAAGRHTAEVFCTTPAARLMRTAFWVAAPQSSSNLFFVIVVSLLVIYAIGWVALRTIAGGWLGARVPTVRR